MQVRKGSWIPFCPEFMRVPKPGPSCLGFLRRMLGPDTVLYFHTLHRSWTVGLWERRRGRLGIAELKLVSKTPKCTLTLAKANEIRRRAFRPEDPMLALVVDESDGRAQDELEDERWLERQRVGDFVERKRGVRVNKIPLKRLLEERRRFKWGI